MAQGRPRHQLCLSLCRKDPSSGSCSQKPEGGPEGTNPSNPTSAGAKSSPPISPPGGRAPRAQSHPTPSRNIALAPHLASPIWQRRPRLTKRRFAPSRHMSGGRPHWPPVAAGEACAQGGAGPPPLAPPPGPSPGRSLWAAGRAGWVTSLRSSAGYSGY